MHNCCLIVAALTVIASENTRTHHALLGNAIDKTPCHMTVFSLPAPSTSQSFPVSTLIPTCLNSRILHTTTACAKYQIKCLTISQTQHVGRGLDRRCATGVAHVSVLTPTIIGVGMTWTLDR